MIYGGEQLIQYPVKDLFDTQLMAMSINAAKDMYEKGAQQIKDFYSTYGDFTSPILKDMDWYNLNVTGRVRNTINNLYANGIDPLRSAEGRAAVQLLIYSMPVGDIAKVKQSAETAKEYLKSFDDNTNPELERFLGRDLSNWSTLGNLANGVSPDGIWKYNKASKYQTIDDLIEPIIKNIDYTYDESLTKSKNDGNDYYTITRDRLMLAVNDNMSDILSTPSGAYHWEQAKKAAAELNGGEALARQIFNTMIANRLSDHERVKFEANPYRLDDYRTRNDIRAHSANASTDHYYWSLQHGGNDDEYNRIFRRAERLVSKKGQLYLGDLVQYTPDQQYYQWMDPVVQAEQRDIKLDTGQTIPGWAYSNNSVAKKGTIYVMDDNGKLKNAKVPNTYEGHYTFAPGGNMRSRKYGNGYKYYISGYMYNPNGGELKVDGNKEIWVEVKERDHNYGQNLRKE